METPGTRRKSDEKKSQKIQLCNFFVAKIKKDEIVIVNGGQEKQN